MFTPPWKRRFAALAAGAALAGSPAPTQAKTTVFLPDLPCGELNDEVVFFGFDNRVFPFQFGVQTHLLMGKFDSIVLRHGSPGAPDEFLRYYGSIIRYDGKFHLWYIGSQGQISTMLGYSRPSVDDKALCYATSDDGVHWDKPDLGLVEFKGSRHNNLVNFRETSLAPAAVVYYEPDDPAPGRRFKLVYEANKGKGAFNVAFSPDGLNWAPSPLNPVGPFMEMTGVTKFKGKYYVTGHDAGTAHQPTAARILVTLVSRDFEHWSPCAAVGLDRSSDLSGPSRDSDRNNLEEIHVGAGLWNRGTVILGVYGQWHGHPSGDRRLAIIDLGLALTHDAVHYEEPVPGFKFIPAREQPEVSANDFPAIVQGQGMENVGEKTYFWYSSWKPNAGTGLRLATWERDRLGMLKPFPINRAAVSANPDAGPQAITCSFRLSPGGTARVWVNASGLGPDSSLRFNLLDDTFRPIPGYSGADGATVNQSGYRVPLGWRGGGPIDSRLGEVHLQVRFTGVRPEDACLHALYLEPVN